MPRYINKQRHTWTCGHVAVTNVLKSIGYNMTYKEGVKLVERLKTDYKNRGCWLYHLLAVFDKYKLKWVLENGASTKRLKSLLQKGAKIVYGYRYTLTCGHWFFLNDTTSTRVQIFNERRNKGSTWYTINHLYRTIKKSRKISKYLDAVVVILPENYMRLSNENKK